jgi:hypothetical protein
MPGAVPGLVGMLLQVEEEGGGGGLSNIPNTIFMRLIISYCRSKSLSVVSHWIDQEKRRQIPVLLYSHDGRKRKVVKEGLVREYFHIKKCTSYSVNI